MRQPCTTSVAAVAAAGTRRVFPGSAGVAREERTPSGTERLQQAKDSAYHRGASLLLCAGLEDGAVSGSGRGWANAIRPYRLAFLGVATYWVWTV